MGKVEESKTVQPRLVDRIGRVEMQLVLDNILKNRHVTEDSTLTDEDGVTYGEVWHDHDGVEFLIRPKHVTIDMVSEYGDSKCNDCYGKGYRTVEVAKGSLRNPSDHVILARKPFAGLSDEAREDLIEEEKKNPRWRILLPCHCALKRMQKVDPSFYVSNDSAIMFRLEYEERQKTE